MIRSMPPGGEPLRHDDSVVVEQVEDELCLYRPQSSDVAVLNPTAADIWALVDGKSSARQIATQLARTYAQCADGIAVEVESVLSDLAERGFLVRD
jgi:hypothetical protein